MAEIGDGDVGNDVVREEAAGGRAALAVIAHVFSLHVLSCGERPSKTQAFSPFSSTAQATTVISTIHDSI